MSGAPTIIAGRSISNYFGIEAGGRQDGAFNVPMQRARRRSARVITAIDCGAAVRGYHGVQHGNAPKINEEGETSHARQDRARGAFRHR
jgi:hypothetical protein